MARIKRHSTSDMMDEWLESQGYYRKHTAKDGSCLFRAVSEQVFHTQALHLEVRTACVQFMERNRKKFEEFIEGSFDDHLCNMQDPKEWAGQVEMSAMAMLFKHDIEVFHEAGKGPYKVTDNGFKKKILLYFSQDNHYDSVYSRGFIADAAVCQATVYEMLYKTVFRMGEDVDLAVEKMLHDKAYAKLRKDSTASIDSNCAAQEFGIGVVVVDQEDDLSSEWKDKDPGSEIRRALALGFPPFPYKVAKALDTEIYRNVEFDIWNEAKKDEIVYEPGVKCLVRLDKDDPEVYHAHIQEISPDKGPVTVYIVELGKKQNVSYESLEPLPLSYNKACWQTLDAYKGKKKIFKKGKFKDLSFSIPLPRGQGPPRPPSQQVQYDAPVLPVGRGRGMIPYGVPRSPSPHIKWVSPVAQRYRQRTISGGRYYVPNIGYNNNDNPNRMYDSKMPYNHQDVNSLPPMQKSCRPASTSVTWVKSIGSVASTTPYSSSTASSENGGMCVNVANQNTATEVNLSNAPPVGSIPVPASNCMVSVAAPVVSSSSCASQPALVPSYAPASACCGFGIPYSVSSMPAPTPVPPPPQASAPLIQPLGQSPLPSPTYITPQPIAIYPCHYYSGVYVPYEPPVHPINYSASRSQDPNGSDLPMQDLATLRFFYNLGCDYFRLATVIPVPSTSQYTMWNYGSQMSYSSVSGYLTPVSNSDGCEALEDSSSTSAACLSPVDSATEAEGIPVDEFFEPAYVYGSSPVSFLPTVYQPLDYCTSIPGLVGEFKGGLVLNEQGMLSLNSVPCQSGLAPTRQRSDSCGSNHSQCSNQDWSLGHNHHKPPHSCANNLNGNVHSLSDATYQNGVAGSTCSAHPSPHGNSSNHLLPRFQRLNMSPQKQPTSPFRGQPVVQVAPTSFPIVQAANPMMTASQPPLGVYSATSPASATVLATAPAAYYSPSQPTAVLFPAAHPQPMSFMPASAQ